MATAEPAYIDTSSYAHLFPDDGSGAVPPEIPDLRRARTAPPNLDNASYHQDYWGLPAETMKGRMGRYGASGMGYPGRHGAADHGWSQDLLFPYGDNMYGGTPGDWSNWGFEGTAAAAAEAAAFAAAYQRMGTGGGAWREESCLPAPPPGLGFEPMSMEDTPSVEDDDDDDISNIATLVALKSLDALSSEGLPICEPVKRGNSNGSTSTACTISEDIAFESLGCRPEGREPPPQSQTLVHFKDEKTGTDYVIWTVDAKKLRGSDKVAVSPPFEIESAALTFKMMLCPKAVSDRKGGASFKKAKGRGFVQIKCEKFEKDRGSVSMNVSVGTGRPDAVWQSPLKDPVRHNFEDCGVCPLPPRPEEKDEWNFTRAVDERSQTFAVRLELLPEKAERSS
eukprot:TRINITY_DN67765_c0_g1_i1.p1 TRINITY_DN67765_c0_g1~~TRINITY_DN67765_c0_g1_i1.p1  ORF type:complete len:395 (-),score=96.25 TRINITY_DN67765_c0_g1_i1:308-1492(-)